MPGTAESGASKKLRTLADKLQWLRELKTPKGEQSPSYEATARHISKVTGVSISGPYFWELATGKTTNPKLHHLQALARYFNVPVAYFTDDAAFEKLDAELELLNTLKRRGVQDITLQNVAGPAADLEIIQGLLGRLQMLDAFGDEDVRETALKAGTLAPEQRSALGAVLDQPELLDALKDGGVREIALRSSGLSDSSRQAVLTMIEQLRRLEENGPR